jgi:cell division protease FtsH
MNSTVKVVFWLLIVVSAFLMWTVVKQDMPGQKELNFSQFMTEVDQGNVKEVTVNLQEVYGKLQNDGATFHTTVPTNYPEMIKKLSDKGVNITVRDASSGSWPSWLLNLAPLILLAALWFIMNRQWQTAFGKLIAPMRQAWINELRKEVAELSSSALHYFETGHEDRKDEEYKRLTELELEIILTVNPRENDHLYLLATIREMMDALEREKGNENQFMGTHKKMMEVARAILNTEWNRVKEAL